MMDEILLKHYIELCEYNKELENKISELEDQIKQSKEHHKEDKSTMVLGHSYSNGHIYW